MTHTIPVGGTPSGVAADSAAHTVYVTNYSSGTVSVIDEATNTVTHTIPVGGGFPYGVAVDPGTHTVYVTNNSAGTVSVIDEATSTVTATVPVGVFPYEVAVDPATHTAYVANANSGTVSVIQMCQLRHACDSAQAEASRPATLNGRVSLRARAAQASDTPS